MPAIARNALVCLLLAAPLAFASAQSEIMDLFGSMAAALADDNADGFIRGFDRNMPGYERLASQIAALIAEAEITSSIQDVKDEGGDAKHSIDLDWILELKSRVGEAGPTLRRQATVHCELVKDKKHWRIVSLTPADFFRAAKFSESK